MCVMETKLKEKSLLKRDKSHTLVCRITGMSISTNYFKFSQTNVMEMAFTTDLLWVVAHGLILKTHVHTCTMYSGKLDTKNDC